MTEPRANITTRKQDGITIVQLQDRKILEEMVINSIGEKLAHLLDDQSQPQLLLDFSNVEHLSSAALGMLITLHKQIAEKRGQLVLANIHPQIFEVFKITRLNKLFNIQSTTEDALKAFG
jgi:anti-sigma B factor antagonist